MESAPQDQVPRPNAATPPKAVRSVLVVEDEPVMNDLVCEILRFYGFVTASALSGEQALAMVAENRPDAVLLDLMLPGISGYEVCHQLKCSRETNMIPVVILSALDRRDDRVRGIRVGADAYVTKPFEPQVVIDALTGTIEKVRQQQAEGLRGRMKLTMEGDMDYLQEVNDLLLGLHANTPLSEEEIQQIHYSLLELAKNAIGWSRRNRRPVMITFEYELRNDCLILRLRDEDQAAGTAPSSCAATAPATEATAEAAGPAQTEAKDSAAAVAPPCVEAPHSSDPLALTFVREKLGIHNGQFDSLLSARFMDEICYDEPRREVTLIKRFGKAM